MDVDGWEVGSKFWEGFVRFVVVLYLLKFGFLLVVLEFGLVSEG